MVINAITRYALTRWFISGLLIMQLVACGGGGSGDAATAQPAGETLQVLSGSVGDGPIAGATVTIYNTAGDVLVTTVSDSNASYTSSVRTTPEDYPLIIEVTGGIDLVTGREPDFRMASVVVSEQDDQVNINPFSTLIVKSAQLMPGGVNQANIDLAKVFVANELGFGLDTGAVPDPVTAVITDSNIADIVRASEAMGEMIRRVRDMAAAAGASLSGDNIVDAIAADMTDGFLDGAGVTGAYPEIATLVDLVSAQVLIETMSNRLKVGGVIATSAMDDAIQISRPSVTAAELTGSVPVTPRMLEQTKTLLDDARFLAATATIDELARAVAGINEAMSADAIAQSLPVNAGAGLGSVIEQAAVDMVASRLPAPAPVPVQTGSITLGWDVPVMRADNTPLSPAEIGGFRIYYGQKAGNYTSSVDISDGSAQQGTVKNIPVGTYYFVITAYDIDGRESGYSAMITKTVK